MKVLSFLLKAGVLVVVRICARRLFQAVGPATLNACVPNISDVRVRGTNIVLSSADRRLECLVDSSVTG